MDSSKVKELVESKSALSNYVDWKIVFFIGLFILVLVIVFLLLFFKFLKKNIQDDLFLNIYSIIGVLIVINFILGLYTITRYYYKMKNMGSKGQKGIRGKVGRQGKNAECNIYKKKNYKMTTNKIPDDLRETIRLPNLGTSPQEVPNQGWHTAFSEKYIGKEDTLKRVPDLPYKILGSSNCYNKSSCYKVDNLQPPNNKPINGAIVNYNTNSINALQFTYDNDIIPKKDSNNNKLFNIDDMCKAIQKPFINDEELMNNPDKYLIKKDNHPIKEVAFTKKELDELYRLIPSNNEGELNYVCKYPDFLKPYNIDYIVFTNDPIKINKGSEILIETTNNNKYMLYGTKLIKGKKNLFMEGYYPTITCKACKFDKYKNEFVSVCDSNLNKNDCLDYGCIYGKKNMKCSLFNTKEECTNQGCIWSGNKKKGNCIIPNKCGGGKVGNTELPHSKTTNFSCPPYSAIYKIETYNTLDNNGEPGKIEGIKFYCRDIDSGKDVMILNEEGEMEYSASFGNTIKDGSNTLEPEFNRLQKQEVKCGINVSKEVNRESGKKKQSPGFISDCGFLYNDNNINGLIVNSCNYYYH